MPIMPRANKKTTKIAFNILGKPANIQKRAYKKIKSDVGSYNGNNVTTDLIHITSKK